MKSKLIFLIPLVVGALSSCGGGNVESSSEEETTIYTSESEPATESESEPEPTLIPLDSEDKEMSKLDRLYSEMWRPQYHYTDPDSWLNDPNGLVYADGVWHMYYQATPHNPAGGVKYWGHATSEDLVHWKFMDYPLVPDATGDMWSGTAITDKDNLSGLFDEDTGHTGIIAAYSTHRQTVGFAYSSDGGRTFTKFNPNQPIVPNPGVNDFRDPCIFYYPEDGTWKMVVAGGQFSIYESEDLYNWDLISKNNIYTECPCFFRITTEDTKEEKWVLTCSSRNYRVGSFDGTRFTPETPVIQMNSGLDSYAGIVFNDAPNNRVIMLNWMQNIAGGYMYSEGIWSQGMTLPVEFKLYTDTRLGYRLRQNPVSELNALRTETLKEIKNVQTEDEDVLEGIRSNTFEMNLDIDVTKSENFKLVLASDGTGKDEVSISYDISGRKLTVDRSNNKYGFQNMTEVNGRYTFTLDAASIVENHLKLHIYFDVSCMEIFVNDGYNYIPMKCNPFTSSKDMYLEGDVYINELSVYEMGSIWFYNKKDINGIHIPSTSKIYVEQNGSIERDIASFNEKEIILEPEDEDVVDAKIINNKLVVTGKALGATKLTLRSGLRYKELDVVVYDSEAGTLINMLGDLETSNCSITTSPFDLTMTGGGGDAFALSKVQGGDFTFSADVTITKGTAAALVFRAKGTTDFYCFNLDLGGRIFKLWKRVSNNFTDLKVASCGSVKLNDTVNMKVQCEGNTIKCYVNDELVITHQDNSHSSGFLGLNTFNATANFANLIVEGGTEKTGIKNNITGLGEMSSVLCYTEEYEDKSFAIVNTGGGDSFSFSGVEKSDLSISADITLDNDGALAFILRARDTNNFYCFNIDSVAKCVKFWKRVSGQTTVVFTQSANIVVGNTYNLKVELEGSTAKVYLNNNLIKEVTDTSLTTGLVGFNSWMASGEYSNFVFLDLN